MNSKRRGWIWIGTGIILAILAALMTVKALSMTTAIQSGQAQSQQLAVVVAKVNIPRYTVISPGMVQTKHIPIDLLPKGAIVNVNDVYGKMLTEDAVVSEVLINQRLVTPQKQINTVGVNIPKNDVIVALPSSDLLSSVGALSPGDHVDILFTLNTGSNLSGSGQVTINAMQNLVIRAIIAPSLINNKEKKTMQEITTANAALLFAVSPQEALTIKFLKDSGAIMDFALRAPDSKNKTLTDSVDMPYIFDVYGIQSISPAPAIPGLATPALKPGQ